MKINLLFVFTLFAFKAQAHQFHTPNFCHPVQTQFCAHIGYDSQPVVGEAFNFVVDLVASQEDLSLVQDAHVELFMPEMGHGSAPVKIKRLDLKHFEVTEAYFVMSGAWTVNIEVVTSNGPLKFEIPFDIK